MIERPLEHITLADIEALVTYRRSEGATLDFKAAFPAPDHRGVRDFLADVTAFANTDGGDIVVGLGEDKNGTAEALLGIDKAGLDEGLRRLDDQLRSCVDPRVPHFRVHEIPYGDVTGPHRVARADC
ncbi:MAG: ATP-binding protein [Pseudomonadota bacterium]